MAQALYRKWRPRQWDEVISQDHVVQTLRNAVRTGHTGHAYLLAGPRGTGKTTTARLLAKALNCLAEDPAQRPCDQCENCRAISEGRFLDLIEIDAASNTSVDDMRSLREKINFSPSQGRYKVYIIDEVHMLSTAAFNALLKTLEEPPPHAIFILATTEVHKIPATVLSRCQRHEFRRIPVSEITRFLREKAKENDIDVEEEALTLIARQATGAMRDAISMLDQLSSSGGKVTLAEAQMVLGTATSVLVVQLVDALLAKDAGAGLAMIQNALDAGTDARQFARQLVDYLRSLLLMKLGNADVLDATTEMRVSMARQAQGFDSAGLLEAIRLFNAATVDSRSSWHPGLGLELALAEYVEEKAAPVPAVVQPAVTQPAVTQQAVAQPAVTQPAPSGQPAPRRTGADAARIAAAQAVSAQADATPPAAPPSDTALRRDAPPAQRQTAAQQSAPPAPPERKGPAVRPPIDEDDGVPEMPPFDPSEIERAPAAASSTVSSAAPSRTPPSSAPNRAAPATPPARAIRQPERTPQARAEQAPSAPAAAPAGAPASPAADPSAAGRVVTQQELIQNWPRIRALVKKRNAFSEGALNSCRSKIIKDNTLVLSFQSEVVKSKMQTVENIDLLRQVLQAIFGINLNVRCVVVTREGTPQADLNVDSDSMVGTALELGGEITFEDQ